MMEISAFVVCPRCRGDLLRNTTSFDCGRCAVSYPVLDEVPQFDAVATDAAPKDAEEAGRNERRTYWDEGWKSRVQQDHAHLTKLASRSDWEAFLARAEAEYDADRYPLSSI